MGVLIMINDIRFSKTKDYDHDALFYTYNDDRRTKDGAAIINIWFKGGWGLIEDELPDIFSHETLHKVLAKLEGHEVCSDLDKWCEKRHWHRYKQTGLSLLPKDLITSKRHIAFCKARCVRSQVKLDLFLHAQAITDAKGR